MQINEKQIPSMSRLLPKKKVVLKCHKNITTAYLSFFTPLIINKIKNDVSKEHIIILF
jgi:hypothetical protein